MFLLDTNVLSEIRKGPHAFPSVLAWNNAMPPELTFVSVITLLEIEKGICRIARRDAVQGANLRRWMEGALLPEFAGRTLDVDTATARRAAALHVPDPQPELDALIAATALTRGLTVVTRSDADFARMGVPVLNPWDTRP
jgi:predicted nucleic acid-binding protein